MASGVGVLWAISFTLKEGSMTESGSAPAVTEKMLLLSFVIATSAILPIVTPLKFLMELDTFTAGDDWAPLGFDNVKFATHDCPDAIPPDATVSNSIPNV